ncbi:DNA-binding protein HU [Spirochaetia bacterium]|nr:DNA-binding protein HU [Spirochaetia bacterium]
MVERKLTKSNIVDLIYNKDDISIEREDVQMVIEHFCEEVKEALFQHYRIEIRGFGTFEVRLRKGRKNARNPRTGKKVSVESHSVAVFRPGRDLKQNIWRVTDEAETVSSLGEA